MNNVNWSYLNTQPQICIYVSLSSSFPSHANIPIGFDNIRMYTVDILYIYISISATRQGKKTSNITEECSIENSSDREVRIPMWEREPVIFFIITISNENFFSNLVYSRRYMVTRFSPPRATHASLSRSLLNTTTG